MARLRQVPRAEATAPIVVGMYDYIFGQRDPVAEPGTEDGTTGDWWTVMANSPDALEHAVGGFLYYQNPNRVLDPVLRELAQARVGWTAQSQFVFAQHCRALRSLEVSEERIAAVATWETATCFDTTEQAVLAYADCLVVDHGRVPDELFGRVVAALGDEAVLELTYIATLYLHHAVLSRALRTEYDDTDEPHLTVPAAEGQP